jgi:hypothetical protein
VYNAERGIGEPREVTKRALARALGCQINDIFPEGKGHEAAANGPVEKAGTHNARSASV